MARPKSHIISEIRRTAAANGGVPLGRGRFEKETGIRYTEWYGIHWARWNDAVREAGLEPNALKAAYELTHLLEKYLELALELGRLPTVGELKLRRTRDPSFPDAKTFARLGGKDERVIKLADYCRAKGNLENVVQWCQQHQDRPAQRPAEDSPPSENGTGYVYLVKHGSRREYRIGSTEDPIKREGELRVQLPERLMPVHVITTDDRFGIEAYWHKRFEAKRKNGDWFELDASDVAAFKRRRFM